MHCLKSAICKHEQTLAWRQSSYEILYLRFPPCNTLAVGMLRGANMKLTFHQLEGPKPHNQRWPFSTTQTSESYIV